VERVARRVLVVPMQPAGGVAAFKLEKGAGQLVKARCGRLASALASPRDESFLGFVFRLRPLQTSRLAYKKWKIKRKR